MRGFIYKDNFDFVEALLFLIFVISIILELSIKNTIVIDIEVAKFFLFIALFIISTYFYFTKISKLFYNFIIIHQIFLIFFFRNDILINGKSEFEVNNLQLIFQILLYALIFFYLLFFCKKFTLPKKITLFLLIFFLFKSLFYGKDYYNFLKNNTIFYNHSDSFKISQNELIYSDTFDKLTYLSSNKNLIHIVLDEFQSNIFLKLYESKIDKKIFKDFIFFKNTLSRYPGTIDSIPSFFIDDYQNSDAKKKYPLSNSLLLSKLNKLKFEINLHTNCDFVGIDIPCSNYSHIYLKNDIFVNNLFFIKIFPPFFHKYFLNNTPAFNETSKLNNKIQHERIYETFQSASFDLFNEFIDNIKLSNNNISKYIFFHSNMSHSPFIYDSNCIPLDDKSLSLQNIENHYTCSINLIIKLLNKLKNIGAYENTTIILSSDHGSIADIDIENEYLLEQLNLSKTSLSHSMPLLMIKEINYSNNMMIYNSDITDLNSIYSNFDLSTLKFQKDDKIDNLEIFINLINKNNKLSKFKVNGNIYNLENYKPLSDN